MTWKLVYPPKSLEYNYYQATNNNEWKHFRFYKQIQRIRLQMSSGESMSEQYNQ